MAPSRGEVWLADLSPAMGHEQAGVRPVLVISEDVLNRSRMELAVILPITSKARPYPTRIAISPPEGGLSVVSYVICEQPRTVSWTRLKKRLGMVSAASMAPIERAVWVMLGMKP